MINIIVVQLTFRPLSNSLKSVFQTVLWVMCKLVLLRCPAYCWVLPLPQGKWKRKWKLLSHVRLFETPMEYTVHGILQARILELVAFPFSRGSSHPRSWTQVFRIVGGFFSAEPQGSPRILGWVAYPLSSGSSQPRDWTGVSCIAGGFFTNWAIRKSKGAPLYFFTIQGIFRILFKKGFFLHKYFKIIARTV